MLINRCVLGFRGSLRWWTGIITLCRRVTPSAALVRLQLLPAAGRRRSRLRRLRLAWRRAISVCHRVYSRTTSAQGPRQGRRRPRFDAPSADGGHTHWRYPYATRHIHRPYPYATRHIHLPYPYATESYPSPSRRCRAVALRRPLWGPCTNRLSSAATPLQLMSIKSPDISCAIGDGNSVSEYPANQGEAELGARRLDALVRLLVSSPCRSIRRIQERAVRAGEAGAAAELGARRLEALVSLLGSVHSGPFTRIPSRVRLLGSLLGSVC